MFENWTSEEVDSFHFKQHLIATFWISATLPGLSLSLPILQLTVINTTIGILLNLPIMYASFHPNLIKRRDCKCFIGSLATADFIMALEVGVFGTIFVMKQELITTRYCSLYAFSVQVIGLSMVLTMATVSVNRYVAICCSSYRYEQLYATTTKRAVAVIVPYLLSAAVQVPVLFETTENGFLTAEKSPAICTTTAAVFPSERTQNTTRLVGSVGFVGTLMIILPAFAVYRRLHQHHRQTKQNVWIREAVNYQNEQRQLLLALSCQTFVATVCSLPIEIIYFFPHLQNWLITILATGLYSCNVSVDPICTLTIVKCYQRAIKNICCRRQNEPQQT